jgi:CO/xanthine dehydrogenase Mo-binding subunit
LPKEKARPQIGRIMPRADAWTKVAGLEKYAADYYDGDFLWAGVKRSDIPHGRLIGIDFEKARQIPGVHAILTSRDVPGPNRQGLVKKDQPVLAADRIRRVGDALAIVLADNKEAMQKALAAIQVDMEPLEAVFDPEAALADGAPCIHEQSPSNVLAETLVTKGVDVEAELSQCDVVIEGHFQTPRQEHAYLETEAGFARLDGNGQIHIIASTQSPHRDRLEIAEALGFEPEKIRITAPFLGGGFGGKDGATVQSLLAVAVLHSNGRPVKMWWDREESFQASFKRMPARLDYRLGADKDGTLRALDCRILMDSGAYEYLTGQVLELSVEHAGGPYRIPNVRIDGKCVYTNNPPGGPFRGFGVPQSTAAMEQMMDMLAERLDMDPVAIRQKNGVRRGDQTPTGATLIHSTGAQACLDRLAEHPLYKNREHWKQQAGPLKRRGAGLALVWQGMGYGPVVADYANAKIELTRDGRFLVDVGVADMGQGNASTYLQIAGEVLNQDVDLMDLVLPDTEKTLPCGSSSASRTTYTYGNALIGAAEALKKRILERASVMTMASSIDGLCLLPGRVRSLDTGREISLSGLARTMAPETRTSVFYWRAPVPQDVIQIKSDSFQSIPHTVFSFGAHMALVEVDELTGHVTAEHYVAVTDAGRAVNPQAFDQQIQGGVAQGLGYALLEDFRVTEGRGLTSDFSTYIIPTALDVPEIISERVELHEATGPYGMKGIGELPMNGPLPATANAVGDALGRRLFTAPLTPDVVLAALAEKDS